MLNKIEQKYDFVSLRVALKSLLILLITGVLLLGFAFNTIQTAEAAPGIRQTINFQGKLVDAQGLNVADSTYSIVFTLYDASSGGTQLWQETRSVSTVDGIFREELGTISSLSGVNFDDDSLYLGIKIGTDPEMTPRVRFTASPYAFQARNVAWSGLQDALDDLAVSMGSYTTSFSYGNATGTSNLFTLSDANNNTGTGRLLSLATGTNSTLNPFHVSAGGVEALVVEASGNVGIGTTDPTQKLDIEGTVRIRGQLYDYNNEVGTPGQILSTTVNGIDWVDSTGVGTDNQTLANVYSQSGNSVGLTAPYGDIRFYRGTSTEILFLSENTGNVGIGTTDPTSKLSVLGTATISDLLTLNNGLNMNGIGITSFIGTGITVTTGSLSLTDTGVISGTYGSESSIPILSVDSQGRLISAGTASIPGAVITFENGLTGTGSTARLGGTLTQDTRFRVGSNEVLFFENSSGYVGVGTTNPGYKLDVNGDIQIATGSELYSNGSATIGNRIYTTPAYVVNGQTFTASIQALDDAVEGLAAGGSGVWTRNSSGYLSPTTITDSVGIGRTAPVSLLDVAGTAWFRGGTGNTTGLFVNSSGNVGIGTTNPSTKLEVFGTMTGSYPTVAKFFDDTAQATGVGGGISFSGKYTDAGAYADAAGIRAVKTNSTSGDYGFGLAFMTRPNLGVFTERMRIGSDGNVGIGTTNPNQKLEVQGNIRTNSGSFISTWYPSTSVVGLNPGTTTVGTLIEAANQQHLLFDLKNNDSADAIAFRYSAVNNETVDSIGFVMKGNGNIGIGTTDPQSNLDVNGYLGFTPSSYSSFLKTGGKGIVLNNGNDIEWLGSTFGNDYGHRLYSIDPGFGSRTELRLATRNNSGTWVDRLSIESSGDIGIGTTDPLSLFSVGPTSQFQINSSGVVTSGTWQGSAISSTYLDSAVILASEIDTYNELNTIVADVTLTHNGLIDTSSELDAIVTDNTGSGALVFGTNPTFTGGITTGTVSNGAGTVLLPSYTFTGDTNMGMYRPAADVLGFVTSGTERFRVAANGNIGIGTTSPATIFNVGGTTNKSISVDSESNRAYYGAYNDAAVLGVNRDPATGSFFSTSKAASYIAMSGGATNGYIDFFATNTNNTNPPVIMRVAGNGNVGINSTTAESTLTVGSNIVHDNGYVSYSNAKATIFEATNNGGSTPNGTRDILNLVREGVNAQAYGNMASFAIGRYENSGTNSRTQLDIKLTDGSFSQGTIMSLRSNGNVGIGTTAPGVLFEAAGTTRLRRGDGLNYIEFSGDAGGNYITSDDAGVNQKNLYISASPTGADATDRSIIFRTGKVAGVLQNRLTIAGDGTATFANAVNMNSTLTLSSTGQDLIDFSGNATNDARGISFNSRTALTADYNDGWLRLNNASEFANGVYTPGSMRVDGGINLNNSALTNIDWSTSDDGSGSGLDADLLDGISSGSFLRNDTDNAMTAYTNELSFPSNTSISNATGDQASLEVLQATPGADAFMQFHVAGDYALYFGLDGNTNDLSVGGWSMGANRYRVWHAGNDGSGSGLDADLLDGISSGSFLRNDTDNAMTAYTNELSFPSNTSISNATGDQASLEVLQATPGADAFMQFHVAGDYALYFGLDGNTNDLSVGGWSMGANRYRVWHAGNDGSGSGLDADLLDGNDSSYYGLYDDFRAFPSNFLDNGTTTADTIAELEGFGAFDSRVSALKTAWSYAGNTDLTDAGGFTEQAGSSWLTWTDNSSDTTRGNITALVVAPNTGGSAGYVGIYNDQGASYSPGWREIWTDMTDGSGSGLDADLWDGNQFSSYLNQAVLTSSNVTFGDVLASGGNVSVASGDDYCKYRLWGSADSNYCIGMNSGQTFGYLNDYAMTFQMNNTAARGWVWRDSSDAASDGAMSLTTDGRLYLKSTAGFGGSVGIGTTAPAATLDVQGAAQFGSGNVNLIDSTGKIAGISSTYFASLNGSAITSLNASNLSSGTVASARLSGSYGISITGNAATATTLATPRTINGVSFNGSANIVVEPYIEDDEATAATRYLTFTDTTTAGYKRLNEDSSLTYNPSTNLLTVGSIAGNGSALTSLNASNLSSGTVADARITGSYTGLVNLTGTGTSSFNLFRAGNGSVSAPAYSFTSDTNVGMYRGGTDILRFSTAGLDRLSILANGNVGIGTTSPSSPLDIDTTASSMAEFRTTAAYGDFQVRGQASDTRISVGVNESGYGRTYSFGYRGDDSLELWYTPDNATFNFNQRWYTNGTSSFRNTVFPYVNLAVNLGTSSNRWGCLYYNNSTLGTCASDVRLKDDIEDFVIEGALEKLTKIRTRTFTYKDDPSRTETLGLIAQEVEEFMPELVVTGSDGYKKINYGTLQWLTIEAIQEQNIRINDTNSKLDYIDSVQVELSETGDVIDALSLEISTNLTEQQTLLEQVNIEKNVLEVTVNSLTDTVQTLSTRLDQTEQALSETQTDVENIDTRVAALEEFFSNITASESAILFQSPTASTSAQIARSITDSEIIFDKKIVAEDDVSVLGTLSATNVAVVGKISNGILDINGYNDETGTPSATITTFGGELKLQHTGMNGIEMVAGKVKVDINGNVLVYQGGVDIAQGDLNIRNGSIKGSESIRGIDVQISEGASEYQVTFTNPNDTTAYAVSVLPTWFTSAIIEEKTIDGFKIRFNQAAPANAKLDWIIIE